MSSRPGANPEGILQQSPGLRAASYPGSTESRPTNPNGVAYVGGERGHNPVGVETRFARYPRVAPPLFLGRGINTAVAHCKHLGCINGEGLSERAGPQPWAGGHNPWDCLQWYSGLVGNDKIRGQEGQPCRKPPSPASASAFVPPLQALTPRFAGGGSRARW